MKYNKPEWLSDAEWHDAEAHADFMVGSNCEYKPKYIRDDSEWTESARDCQMCIYRDIDDDGWNGRYLERNCKKFPDSEKKHKPIRVLRYEEACPFCKYEDEDEFYSNFNNLSTKRLVGRKLDREHPELSEEEWSEILNKVVDDYNRRERAKEVKAIRKAYEDAREAVFNNIFRVYHGARRGEETPEFKNDYEEAKKKYNKDNGYGLSVAFDSAEEEELFNS